MTINDLQLSECYRKMDAGYTERDMLTREGREKSLFLALKKIRDSAEDAMERLNRLKYGGA